MINDFYTCHDTESREAELSCCIVFNADHAIFKGHFPGQPVVPGVCMMEIVKELLQSTVNKPLMLRNVRSVKFLGFISPDMQPVVNVKWKEGEGGYVVTASFGLNGAALFKLDGVYGAFKQ